MTHAPVRTVAGTAAGEAPRASRAHAGSGASRAHAGSGASRAHAGPGALRTLVTACAWALAGAAAHAGATTDGSVGAVQSLGGAFTVPQSLGTQRGANLFHSFARFSVGSTESATFTTTDPGIAHVISRVTGGEASTIEGPVQLQAAPGSAPSFWFVNPSGIVVGAGGRFDVPAGLHLATTPELRFADGAVWRTGDAGSSTLTVAAPRSFGFLDAQPAGALRFSNTWSQLAPGQPLTLAGGDITLEASVLSAPSGRVQVQAGGALALTGGSRIDAVAYPIDASGRIEVDAASVQLQGNGGRNIAGLYAETGRGGGGGIVVRTPGALELSYGAEISIYSVAEAGGAAVAPIEVSAGSLRLSGQGASVEIGSHQFGGALAGPDVRVRVDGSLQLDAGTRLTTYSRTAGAAGNLQVQAAQITLDGGGNHGVASLDSLASGTGAAGAVTVTARDAVLLRNGGQIRSSAIGASDSGSVQITAPLVQLEGGADSVTTIGSGTLGDDSLQAATVRLDVSELDVRGSGRIASESAGLAGSAGAVVVRADRVLLDGLGPYAGGISTMAYGALGDAGRVDLQARESLIIRDGGAILTGSLGYGRTGLIAVDTPLLRIDGAGSQSIYTGIGGDALGLGAGGQVQVHATRVELLHGGMISSATNTAADAGSVTLQADTLHIDAGGPSSSATGISADSSGPGRAGSIGVQARVIEVLGEGSISSSAVASGPGGAIDVQAGSLTIDRAGGIYTVAASSGDAGSITLRVRDALTIAQGGSIVANTGGSGAAGQVTISAGSLDLSGVDPASGITSRIVSRALVGSGGRTGSLDIDVSGQTSLRDHAELSITNRATVPDPSALAGTTLTLRTGSLVLQDAEISAAAIGNTAAGRLDLAVAGAARLERAGILTSAVDGDGGPISLRTGGTLRLRDARITTSVEGSSNGNGGDIAIAAGALVLQSGFVQANTAAALARGGQVRVATPVLLPDGSRVAIGGAQIESLRPGVAGGNVIQAAAPDGVAGTLAVTLPQLDLAASLTRLVVPRIDFGPFGRDLCEAGDDSSFTVLGRGALPPRAGAPLRIEP